MVDAGLRVEPVWFTTQQIGGAYIERRKRSVPSRVVKAQALTSTRQFADRKGLRSLADDIKNDRGKVLIPDSLSDRVQGFRGVRFAVAADEHHGRNSLHIEDGLGADETVGSQQGSDGFIRAPA